MMLLALFAVMALFNLRQMKGTSIFVMIAILLITESAGSLMVIVQPLAVKVSLSNQFLPETFFLNLRIHSIENQRYCYVFSLTDDIVLRNKSPYPAV